MFKNLFEKIRLMKANKRYKRSVDLNVKTFHIRNAVIKWYMDYDRIHNVVDIPAYIRAKRVMEKTLKTPQDIDRAYRKLLEYEQTVA
jgi:hypothetical protein